MLPPRCFANTMAKRRPLSKEAKDAGAKFNFSQEDADRLCEILSTSTINIHKLLKDNNLPSWPVISEWLELYPSFVTQYARAREAQADFLAGQTVEIADDSTNDTLVDDEGRERINAEWVNRSRLRVDARKWMASKLAPKKYGDKLDVTTDGKEITFKVYNGIDPSKV